MLGHIPNNILIPHPFLQYLTRQLHKVLLHRCATKSLYSSLRGHMMHNMSKLMKECHHLLMLQQRWVVFRWLSKVGDHGCDGSFEVTVYDRSGKNGEDASVPVLKVSRVKVQVEVAQDRS